MKHFILSVFFILFLSSTNSYASGFLNSSDDDDSRTDIGITHSLGFKLSNVSFSGLAYTHRLIEDTYIQFGGFFTYDADDSNTDYRYQLGLELQQAIVNIGEMTLLFIIGGAIDQQRNDSNLSNPEQNWVQFGTGISARNVTSSGLTVSFDGGVLRYRNVSGSNDSSTFGIGGGIYVGYSW